VGWRVSLTIALVLAASTSIRLRSWPDTPSFPAVFLWLLAVWVPWAPATVLVFELSKRLPLVSRRSVTIFLHLAASLALALAHSAYFVGLSSRFSPFLGLPLTKYGAYAFFFLFWFQLDLLLYWALLALATIRSSEAELRRRERQTRELELQVAESQLQALRLQIQPHFLFNTLNTVVAMQRVGDIDKATRMTVALSELLRLLLASGDAHKVTLSRELELLERYLEIERFRFEDRLVVERSVEGDLERASVPTLLLQPLVENAIRHGVASLSGRREVRVSVRKSGDRLAIEVVNDTDRQQGSAEGLGIGLQNIRKRLRELYASDHELSLKIEGGRSLVRVELPLQWSPGGTG
jgi:sensor histidine kinase YesM